MTAPIPSLSNERLQEIQHEYADLRDRLTGELKDGPGAASAFYMSASLGEIADIASELFALRPYRDELLRIAEQVGEQDDPFAAWESVAHMQTALRAAGQGGATVKPETLAAIDFIADVTTRADALGMAKYPTAEIKLLLTAARENAGAKQ